MPNSKTNGVLHHTMPPEPDTLTVAQALFTAHPEVKHVRYAITDYGNILRMRLCPKARTLQLAANPGSGIVTPSPLTSAVLPTGQLQFDLLNADSDLWEPDWSSLRHCTYSPAHALVMCDVRECYETASDQFARDPRSILARAVATAKEKYNLTFLVGHEIEYFLLPEHGSPTPVATSGSAWSASVLRTPYYAVLEESVDALEAAGLPVYGFHPEDGTGGFEIALSPLPPLEAADALVFAQDTIKTIAARHGWHATMHPRPFETPDCKGAHVHMSVSRPEIEDAFLAGVLKHQSALMAFTNANADSYSRDKLFGNGWVAWARRAKNAPISQKGPGYWEFRSPDALSNMYLILAAMLTAGCAGVEDDEPLTMKPRTDGKFMLTDDEAKELGLEQKLPASLDEALRALRAEQEFWSAWLGEKFVERYLCYKTRDLQATQALTATDRRNKLTQEY